MISTVTTTIVTLTGGASFSILVAMLLIFLLGAKELVPTEPANKIDTRRLSVSSFSKNLNYTLLPLTFTFALIVLFKVIFTVA